MGNNASTTISITLRIRGEKEEATSEIYSSW